MMTTVDHSRTAVSKLSEVDPAFRTLVETLYGAGVDAEAIWQDVYKMNPDPSSVSTPSMPGPSTGKKVKHAIAVGATLAGGALAVKELKGEAGGIKAAVKARNLRAVPKGALLAGTALGGDLVTADDLTDNPNKQQVGKRLVPVSKLSTHGIGQMAEGITTKLKGLLPVATGGTHRAAKATKEASGESEALKNGRAVHQLGSSLVRSTPGKVVLGAGAAKVGVDAHKRKAESNAYMGGYDQYPAFGKSDDLLIEGTFAKFDDDKRLAFGWASVVEKDGLPVVDRQDDYIHPDDLEIAAYDYMIKSRKGGHMHKRDALDAPVHVSDIVESVVFTTDKIAKMGLPDTMPRGWWIGVKVHDDDVWGEVKKGGLAGFSIHGRGKRRDQTLDETMGR